MKVTLTRQSISNNNVHTLAIDAQGKPAANGNHVYFGELRCSANWQAGQCITCTSERGETKDVEITDVSRPVTGDVILTLVAAPSYKGQEKWTSGYELRWVIGTDESGPAKVIRATSGEQTVCFRGTYAQAVQWLERRACRPAHTS